MRALSIHWQHCQAILAGKKKQEYRSWRLSLGDLLICSTASTDPTGSGRTIAIVKVASIDADNRPDSDGGYAWRLTDIRPVKLVGIKGAQGIYHVQDALIVPIDGAAIEVSATPPARPRPLAPVVELRPAKPRPELVYVEPMVAERLAEQARLASMTIEARRAELDQRIQEARARLAKLQNRGSRLFANARTIEEWTT